jgi:hypothetical protein
VLGASTASPPSASRSHHLQVRHQQQRRGLQNPLRRVSLTAVFSHPSCGLRCGAWEPEHWFPTTPRCGAELVILTAKFTSRARRKTCWRTEPTAAPTPPATTPCALSTTDHRRTAQEPPRSVSNYLVPQCKPSDCPDNVPLFPCVSAGFSSPCSFAPPRRLRRPLGLVDPFIGTVGDGDLASPSLWLHQVSPDRPGSSGAVGCDLLKITAFPAAHYVGVALGQLSVFRYQRTQDPLRPLLDRKIRSATPSYYAVTSPRGT